MFLRFAVKLLIHSAVLIPLLYLLTDGSVTEIVMTAAGLAVVSFLIGDQLILRHTSNLVATIGDIGIAGLWFWGAARYFDWSMTTSEIVLSAVGVGIVEFMYHLILIQWDKRRNAFSYDEIDE